jgi:hypothetical protein
MWLLTTPVSIDLQQQKHVCIDLISAGCAGAFEALIDEQIAGDAQRKVGSSTRNVRQKHQRAATAPGAAGTLQVQLIDKEIAGDACCNTSSSTYKMLKHQLAATPSVIAGTLRN